MIIKTKIPAQTRSKNHKSNCLNMYLFIAIIPTESRTFVLNGNLIWYESAIRTQRYSHRNTHSPLGFPARSTAPIICNVVLAGECNQIIFIARRTAKDDNGSPTPCRHERLGKGWTMKLWILLRRCFCINTERTEWPIIMQPAQRSLHETVWAHSISEMPPNHV